MSFIGFIGFLEFTGFIRLVRLVGFRVTTLGFRVLTALPSPLG